MFSISKNLPVAKNGAFSLLYSDEPCGALYSEVRGLFQLLHLIHPYFHLVTLSETTRQAHYNGIFVSECTALTRNDPRVSENL